MFIPRPIRGIESLKRHHAVEHKINFIEGPMKVRFGRMDIYRYREIKSRMFTTRQNFSNLATGVSFDDLVVRVQFNLHKFSRAV